MAKNLKKLISFFTKVFSAFVFVLPISATPDWKLTGINSSHYPEISLEGRRLGFSSSNKDQFSITESWGDTKKFVGDIQFQESKKPSPLRLFLSVPSFRNPEERYWILQLSSTIARLCEKSKGKFYLHVLNDDDFLLFENLNSEKIANSFALPGKKESKYPIRSLERLVDYIQKDKESESILVSVFWNESKLDFFRSMDLAKKIKSSSLPYYIYAFGSSEMQNLSNDSQARFYQMEKRESYSRFLQDLEIVNQPKFQITYISPWKFSFWEEREISVDTVLPDQSLASFSYQENFSLFILRKLKDPFLFFPVFIFLILLCFSILYYLKGFEEKQLTRDSFSSKPQVSQNSTKDSSPDSYQAEQSIYQNLYGSVYQKAREREEVQKVLEKENLEGFDYGYAVLVQKDGIKAGHRFSLDKEETILGRGESCDLVIWDNLVEPKHAKIKKVGGKFILFDMASDLGVFLNGKKLLRPKSLTDMDEIRVGRTVFSFRAR